LARLGDLPCPAPAIVFLLPSRRSWRFGGAATAWRAERLGRASVILLALWPASLLLVLYSEAVFVATSVGAVWADRRGHRVSAAMLLAGAALGRSIGVLVGLVLVATRVWRRRRIDATAVLYGVAAVVGIGVVMYVQYRQAGMRSLSWKRRKTRVGRSPHSGSPWVRHWRTEID
jgi:hypothetical protein